MKKFLLLILLSLPIFVNAQKLMTADVAQMYENGEWYDMKEGGISIELQEKYIIFKWDFKEDQISFKLDDYIINKEDIFVPNGSGHYYIRFSFYYTTNNVLILKQETADDDIRYKLKNVKYYIEQ